MKLSDNGLNIKHQKFAVNMYNRNIRDIGICIIEISEILEHV